MALNKINNDYKVRTWIDTQDSVYNDLNEGFRVPERLDGDVIRVKNNTGDELYFKRFEIADVIIGVLDKVLEDKDIDLYHKINQELRKHIDTNIEILETETKKYFFDKIDKVAENIAIKLLDSEIERQVKERVEAKLEQMRKLL